MGESNVYLLKNEIERVFGRKILTSADCLQLAEDVFIKTGATLNSNTLRRCFGLVKAFYPPSLTTLTILSKYCGFSSYDDLITYKHSYTKPDEPDAHSLLLKHFTSLFKNLHFIDGNDKVALSLVRSIIELIRQEPTLAYTFQQEIAKTKIGQEYYFEEFVHIDMLNDYYGDGLRYYLLEKKTEEAQIFAHSLLVLRYWLTCNSKSLKMHYEEVIKIKLTDKIHPFVWARHFATRLLYANAHQLDTQGIMEEAHRHFEMLKPPADHYRSLPCFELIFTEALILTGNYEESLFYAETGLARERTARKEVIHIDLALFYSLRLYRAIALGYGSRKEEAMKRFEQLNPAHYYFLSRQYFTILHLQLAARLNRSRSHEEQIKHLIAETGFQKLSDLTPGN